MSNTKTQTDFRSEDKQPQNQRDIKQREKGAQEYGHRRFFGIDVKLRSQTDGASAKGRDRIQNHQMVHSRMVKMEIPVVQDDDGCDDQGPDQKFPHEW